MQIVFLCSEYEGLIKTGGLADATRGLAQQMLQLGHRVKVIIPRYAALYALPTSAQFTSVYTQLGGQTYGCAIRHTEVDGIEIALVEHHDFFNRARPYDDGEQAYVDNALRFAFFCKAALAYLTQTGSCPDIIHGHDWQSALAAVYLKQMHASGQLGQSRFVFTIHNAAYQQGIGWHELHGLDIAPEFVPANVALSLLCLGVAHSAKFNTVSAGYREELLSEPAANGLSPLYQQRQADFLGILNGCDYGRWDPATDQALTACYSVDDLTGKNQCKAALLQHVGLAQSQQPLFVAVSRITSQKGFSYLIPALEQWLRQNRAMVVMMGTGEQQFIQPLKHLQQSFPEQFRFIEGFDEHFSHQLEAAGDFFLMPSLFEPCGLNQIYSLRYGTVPLVRATGGLKDTVRGLDMRAPTGIRFNDPTVADLSAALSEAVQLYEDQKKYRAIQQRGMKLYFGWDQAARHYLKMYQQAHS